MFIGFLIIAVPTVITMVAIECAYRFISNAMINFHL